MPDGERFRHTVEQTLGVFIVTAPKFKAQKRGIEEIALDHYSHRGFFPYLTCPVGMSLSQPRIHCRMETAAQCQRGQV